MMRMKVFPSPSWYFTDFTIRWSSWMSMSVAGCKPSSSLAEASYTPPGSTPSNALPTAAASRP